MFGWEITFDKPWYLATLLALPLLWYFSYRSLAGLGRVRRIVALTLRTTILAIFVIALAEIQMLWTSDRLAVIYLLDQSLSIPESQRDAMREYVTKAVREQRKRDTNDMAGVIVFGRDATIEVPPFDDDVVTAGQFESLFQIPRDATNLESALKLAQASFPENVARRVVIVTDGNENMGDARSVARNLAESGVGIDVVPVALSSPTEIAVEKVALPPDIRQSQPFEVRVVVNNYADTETPVPGTLDVIRRAGREETKVSSEKVVLRGGKNVYAFQQTLDDPAVYTYRARFTPDDPQKTDGISQNNEATAFTHIRGKGRLLLIEDAENPGQFTDLVDRLRAMSLEVDVQPSNNLFTNLAELQAYDTVVLANVPRSTGDRLDQISSFSDEQILMLVRNTEQLGCGLVMLGGENSFGVGGWANTELEKAMPVDFQIKNAKIQAVGALALVMHASELADGNGIQKEIGRKAVEVLGPMDYCGMIHWDDFAGRESWLWNASQGGLVRVGTHKRRMLSQIDRMSPGDMPDFDPALRMALSGFQRTKASIKHMIAISDGDPAPPSSFLLGQFRSAGITISTVGVGTHGGANDAMLERVAAATGGKYYSVSNPASLPAIFMREARKAARPLVKNLENVPPVVTYRHEILQGVEGDFPPLTGFVLTTVKDSPLVEVSLRSPDPSDAENSTVMAAWTYGLGRTVAFTSDAGDKWARPWLSWPHYDKFFSQMIRWSMRPLGDTGKFTVASDFKDGRVRVVVTALDKNDDFLNFLNMSAAGLDPKLGPIDLKMEQTAPGRYVTEFPAQQAGSYFVTINPGPGHPPLLTGVNVPYSPEFRDRETNRALLESLVALRPKDGEAGTIIAGDLAAGRVDSLLKTDTFRHTLAKAISSQNIWPLVLLAATCLFFADVFVRRVSLSWEWLAPTWQWIRTRILGRKEEAPVAANLERLRGRKAAVAGQIDERRAAARFEPTVAEQPPGGDAPVVVDDIMADRPIATPAPRPQDAALGPVDAEQASYTSRLLKAKQAARRDQAKPDDDADR